MKKAYRSKTIGANISVLAISPLYPPLHEWIRTHGDQAMAAVCVLNILLRFFTQSKLQLSMGKVKTLLIFLASFVLIGCEHQAKNEISSDIYYDRLMRMEIDGVQYTGAAVLPLKPKYQIKIRTPGDIDFLLVKSCQRREIYEPKKSEFTFTFSPKPTEKAIPCPLEFEAMEKGKNRLTLGKVIIPTEGYELPGTLDCNEKPLQAMSHGVSYCESGAMYHQTLSFSAVVDFDIHLSHCAEFVDPTGHKRPYFERKNPNLVTFRIPRGDCTIIFKEVGAPKFHLLYTYGVDETLPERN